MITIVFLLLCAIEAGLFYWKYSEIQEYRELGQDVAIATGVEKHRRYGAFIRIAGKVLGFTKYFLIIIIPLLLLANWIVALVIGSILNIFF